MRLTRLESVYVTWEDSVTKSGWHYDERMLNNTLPAIKTIGFVVENAATSLTLAHSIDSVGKGAVGLITIPKRAIISITRLGNKHGHR